MRVKSAEAPVPVARTLNLHDQAIRRLESLRDNTEAASDSEVVRKALLYFEQFVEDLDGGWTLLIRDDSGSELLLAAPSDANEPAQSVGRSVKRNLMLHPKSAERLDMLKKHTKAASDSELVRNALKFYETLVDYALEGKHIVARNVALDRETTYFIPVSRRCARSNRSLQWYTRVVESLRPS